MITVQKLARMSKEMRELRRRSKLATKKLYAARKNFRLARKEYRDTHEAVQNFFRRYL